MSKLALFGGPKVREDLFPSQNTFDHEEMQAVWRVMKEGRLSGYRGSWCPEFFGGPEIQALETEWKKKFNVKHAIAVNSCTSGLHVACGAIGLTPGSEVIVTPYSMTCSSTAPMIYGAIPVFADIDNYCALDPKSIEERITPNTKAIIVVSLFGMPYNPKINNIAKKHGLLIIEDAAQAIGSGLSLGYDEANGEHFIHAGNLGDIGVYSFNFGKHINAGEGGIVVTNNDDLAFRVRLFANHGEAVISAMNPEESRNMISENIVGFNMRMTELQAAIIRVQLKKLDGFIKTRRENVNTLHNILEQIPAITLSPIRDNCTHSYYVDSYLWDSKQAKNLYRDKFIEAVKAELTPRAGREGEGVPIGCGYISPLYLMPLFQQQNPLSPNYKKGSCPNCEDLSFNKLFLSLFHAPRSTKDDMKDVGKAFQKVWENRKELK